MSSASGSRISPKARAQGKPTRVWDVTAAARERRTLCAHRSHPNKYYYYEIEPCIRRPDKQWSRLLLLLLNYWCHPFRIHKTYMYMYII